MPKNIAIFASGSGSNAENIAQYFKKSNSIAVKVILSNKPDAFVLERAKKLQIPGIVFSAKELSASNIVDEILKEYKIDFIVLAGFLLKVPDSIVKSYPNKIINIHPSLLPKYGGKGMFGDHVHNAVVEAGETESGITIHYINEHYDEGNIYFQARCKINPEDSAEDVAKKIHELEYQYFPPKIEEIINKI